MKLLGAALILCGAALQCHALLGHGGRSVPAAGAFRRIGGLGARDTRLAQLPLPRLLGQRGGGKYADAFFADDARAAGRMGRRCRTAGASRRRRRSASGSRLCYPVLPTPSAGRTRCSAPLRAAAQALRGTLTERGAAERARDTRLVTTLCFSLSLPCHDTAYLNREKHFYTGDRYGH